MATVSFTVLQPSAPSGFTATSTGPLSVKIQWGVLQPGERCEVWRHTVNDVTLASKITTVSDITYTDTNFTVGGTYYYWLRTINQYDVVGAYDVANTSGHSVVVTGVDTVNIEQYAVTDTLMVVSSGDVFYENTDYGVPETIFTQSFTGTENLTELLFTCEALSETIQSTADSGVTRSTLLFSLTDDTSGGAEASSTKWHSSTAEILLGGTWSNLANLATADGSFASVTYASGGHNDLLLYGYDFLHGLAATDTIVDIQVNVKGYATGGTGTPKIEVELCWDGVNFPTSAGQVISENSHLIYLTGTNTLYSVGWNNISNNPADPGQIANNQHWLSSWGRRVQFKDAGVTRIYTNLTTADIRDSNFGIALYPAGTYTNGTYYVDYVEVIVRYTTQDIRTQQVTDLSARYANTNYAEPSNNGPVHRYVFTPVVGHTYTYKVRAIRTRMDKDHKSQSVTTNRVLSIREYKR